MPYLAVLLLFLQVVSGYRLVPSHTTTTYTLTGPETATATKISTTGTTTVNSTALSGFPSVPVTSGATVSFSIVFEGAVTVGDPDIGNGEMRYQYSTDGGSTWSYMPAFNFATETTTFPPRTATRSTAAITNLNQVEFRAIAIAHIATHRPGGSGITTDSILDSATATY